MASGQSGKEMLFTLGAAILGVLVVVRGTLSLMPDALRYDRYGDTRGIIVAAMYLLGIATAGVIIKALNGRSGNNPD